MKRPLLLLPLLALAAAGCGSRPATSCATVAVTRVKPARDGIPGGPGTFDPVFLRSQFDVIRSRPVLSEVVRTNGLGAVLDAAYGWKSACPDDAADRAVAYLAERTDPFIWKDREELIGIEVSIDRKVPDAEALSRKLASDIARAYRAYENALREKEIEAAAAELRAEIDSLGRQIEASAPGARSDLEWRRAEPRRGKTRRERRERGVSFRLASGALHRARRETLERFHLFRSL